MTLGFHKHCYATFLPVTESMWFWIVLALMKKQNWILAPKNFLLDILNTSLVLPMQSGHRCYSEWHLHQPLMNMPLVLFVEDRIVSFKFGPFAAKWCAWYKTKHTKAKTQHKESELLCRMRQQESWLPFLLCSYAKAQWTAPDLKFQVTRAAAKLGASLPVSAFSSPAEVQIYWKGRTLIMGERKRMGRTGFRSPDKQTLRREVDPQLALILKVVRSHLRKGGI